MKRYQVSSNSHQNPYSCNRLRLETDDAHSDDLLKVWTSSVPHHCLMTEYLKYLTSMINTLFFLTAIVLFCTCISVGFSLRVCKR